MDKLDRIVLFDIDKTLLVGSTVHYAALKNAISEVYGIKNPGNVANLQGMTDLKIICATLYNENMDLETIKSGLDECMQLMYMNFKDSLQTEDLVVLNGVKNLLKHLKRYKIPMGLVTGNMETIAWLKLEKVGLNDYFEFGGFGDQAVTRSSLVVKALEEARNLYGEMKRENIFVVGDTPRDIIGGQKSGVRTVAVATGDFSMEELEHSGPDFLLENLKDTKKVLEIVIEGQIDTYPEFCSSE